MRLSVQAWAWQWPCGLGAVSQSCSFLKHGSLPSHGNAWIYFYCFDFFVHSEIHNLNPFIQVLPSSRPLSMPTGVPGGISLPIWMGLNSAVIKVFYDFPCYDINLAWLFIYSNMDGTDCCFCSWLFSICETISKWLSVILTSAIVSLINLSNFFDYM